MRFEERLDQAFKISSKALDKIIEVNGCKFVSNDQKETSRNKEFLTTIFTQCGYPYQDIPEE